MPGMDLFGRPSTVDTGARNALDYYETPQWMLASLLEHHPINPRGVVFEPCAGDGAIARGLLAAGFGHVITNDINVAHPTDFHGDATKLNLWRLSALADVSWVITNPPFAVAIQVLEQSWLLAHVGVAMLLRKTFLEPTGRLHRPKPHEDRGPWLAVHPPTHIIGLPRHKFRRQAKGTDNVSADWMIWRRDGYTARPFVIDHTAKTRRIA
jgi:hypothetical protein